MEVIRRVLVFLGHVQLGDNNGQLVDELEVERHISHGFGFDTAGHTTRCPRSLDLFLITFREIPDRVVRMAENPEVISAYIGEFLKVGLVYSGLV